MDTKEFVEKRKAFIAVLLQELNGGTIFVNEAEQVQKLIRSIESKNKNEERKYQLQSIISQLKRFNRINASDFPFVLSVLEHYERNE